MTYGHPGLSEGRVAHDSARQRIETHRDQLEVYEQLCRELSAKPAPQAYAW